ncbi:hypothetical protein HD553DRAFT_321006 [Filobasidium floriforme]|uniref:uncharacterized protein n=1 Tax=Filobasidium floriforme TaxID=5210 RepID=UPI001E8D7E1E|nr:uncharacterized protein HD553DRAFT_321006 [Filobasidium floriforme]KAH8090270.1 hypothetical protein HD553DRAFT_321006 [Filobasidium floriforme]
MPLASIDRRSRASRRPLIFDLSHLQYFDASACDWDDQTTHAMAVMLEEDKFVFVNNNWHEWGVRYPCPYVLTIGKLPEDHEQNAVRPEFGFHMPFIEDQEWGISAVGLEKVRELYVLPSWVRTAETRWTHALYESGLRDRCGEWGRDQVLRAIQYQQTRTEHADVASMDPCEMLTSLVTELGKRGFEVRSQLEGSSVADTKRNYLQGILSKRVLSERHASESVSRYTEEDRRDDDRLSCQHGTAMLMGQPETSDGIANAIRNMQRSENKAFRRALSDAISPVVPKIYMGLRSTQCLRLSVDRLSRESSELFEFVQEEIDARAREAAFLLEAPSSYSIATTQNDH